MKRVISVCLVILISSLLAFPFTAYAEGEPVEDISEVFNFDELAYTNMYDNSIKIGIGETYDFKTALNFDFDFVNHRFLSSNEKVATVDENGIVTAVGKGNATITLQLADATEYTCNIEVFNEPTKMTILNTDNELVKDWGSSHLYVKLSGGYTQFLNYTSSDESILKVDSNGKITPVHKGTSVITVSAYNGLNASFKFKVIDEKDALQVNKNATEISYKYENVKKYVFGKSVRGRNLEAFIITPKNGKFTKTYVMTFAIHGHEDSYRHDGLVLTNEGNKLVEYYAKNNNKLKNFRLVIIPCLNPDGAIDGTNNLRTGKRAFGRNTAKHIDMNRDFSSKRLHAKESKALVQLLDEYKPDVFTDFHGWLNESIGTTQMCNIFDKNMNLGIKMKGAYFPNYLYAYVRNRYKCASSLIEYKSPSKVSHKKTYISVNKVIAYYNK